MVCPMKSIAESVLPIREANIITVIDTDGSSKLSATSRMYGVLSYDFGPGKPDSPSAIVRNSSAHCQHGLEIRSAKTRSIDVRKVSIIPDPPAP
ncbi:MAG: hypothetical protein BWY82_01979 [Verrucomicrobia bacterium ADurb.Bin474]|nr:MAG: hypothetical protein BWY82_01979 [Verrucomicrobia bacterium ADurb.Bin474]